MKTFTASQKQAIDKGRLKSGYLLDIILQSPSSVIKTSSTNNKYTPQMHVFESYIYYVWIEFTGSNWELWTGKMNIDGTGWTASSRVSNTYAKYYPQLQVVGTKIYYVWGEWDGSLDQQIWTAVMDIDGTGWTATKRTTSAYNKYFSQFHVVDGDSKIYYVWSEHDGSQTQIWTAVMDIDGTGWTATKRTTSADGKDNPQLQVVGTKIYYVYRQSGELWTAVMDTDGTGWSATKREDATGLIQPQLQVVGTKIYYIWSEPGLESWTAVMNTDGTGWVKTQRNMPNDEPGMRPQLQVVGDKIHYIWDAEQATPSFNRQIWIGETNLDGSEWNVTQKTYSSSLKTYPQFQYVDSNVYYVWIDQDGGDYEIAVGDSVILYVSDRNIEIDSHNYEDYLSDLSGLGEEIKRATSEGLNPDINLKFKNDKWRSNNYLIEIGDTYSWEGSVTTIKEVYFDDNDNPTESLIIFKGTLDEPQNIDLMSFECSVSSMVMTKDSQFKQELITEAEYTSVDPDDLNKVQNIIYGSCERVKCHAIKAGAMDNLSEDISDTAMSFDLSDASRFPSSGSFTIQIDAEKMLIGSRSGNTLTVTTRGYSSTTAVDHDAGALAFEVLTEYIYLVASHPVKTLGDIYVDGLRQITGFTKYTGQSGSEHANYPGKAVIKFTAKPIINKQVNIEITDTIDVSSNSVSTMQINPSGGQSELRDGSLVTYYDAFTGIMTYPGTSYGTMIRRRHFVHVENLHATASKTLKIALSWDPFTYVTINIPPGVKTTVYAQYSGSNWTEGTKCVGEDSNIRIYEVWKEADYTIDVTKSGTVTAIGNSSADVVVGASVNVDVDGYQDDSDGTYTGSADALIERPDHVLKHFINVLYGFAISDINTSSFSTAGTSYAGAISGGYKFAFLINEEIKPSKFISNLAFQCRSCLRYEAGEWYLDYLPDTSPSAVKTISKADMAGKNTKFLFNKTPNLDIVNDLTAKFQKNYERLKFDESEWLGTSTDEDIVSKETYGVRPKEYEFNAIRIQEMADHVLAFVKLQRKNSLLIVEFPVFWEYFELERGDTFDISNDLYDAEKFHIEKIKKLDKFKLQITGLEWP